MALESLGTYSGRFLASTLLHTQHVATLFHSTAFIHWKGKERKGKERKGKERKGKERKGKERKGKDATVKTIAMSQERLVHELSFPVSVLLTPNEQTEDLMPYTQAFDMCTNVASLRCRLSSGQQSDVECNLLQWTRALPLPDLIHRTSG